MQETEDIVTRVQELLPQCTALEDMPGPYDEDRHYSEREIARLNNDRELRCLVPELLTTIATLRAEVEGLRADAAANRKLALFGAAMLHAHRGNDASEIGDIDGFTAQEQAVKCGVLEERTVTEPCGEHCVCGEVTDFPLECYFVPADVRTAIDAANADKEGA